MRLALGTILRDKYHVVRKLSERDDGDVFEVRHLELAGRYALKLLCEGGTRNAVLLDELRREALATSALSHPGIIRVLDLDQAPDGSPFIVTEYLDGQDLGRVIRRMGPMALPDVAAIVEAIASPLAEAHRYAIIHGDLTPENVFVVNAEADPHARVKVLDFGVARIRARAGGVVRGAGPASAAAYVAPERRRGREWEIDERADVFSLGAITYALISGRAPGAPARVTGAGPAPRGEEAPALAAPPAVAAAVARAMSKDPDGRFRSVTEFAQAFRAAVAGSPGRPSGVRTTRLGPTPAVPLATLHRPTDRIRILKGMQRTVAAAVGCGLAILIGVVTFTKLSRPPVAKFRVVASAPPLPPPTPRLPAPAPAPPPAAPPLPAADVASDKARQPLPAHDEGAVHHHRRRSAHAGMTDADRQEMEESYRKATRAFDVGEYDAAIAAYKRTYELGGDAPMLYNIAQALRLSKRPDEAVTYYRRYLDRAQAAPNREEVRVRIAQLTRESEAPSPVKAASTAAATAISARSPLDCHWPERATLGKAIDVSCTDADPQTLVARVVVHYRASGTLAFSPAEMTRASAGSYRVSIPAAAVSEKGLELYFEGRRASGETIAQNGSATHPNGLHVAPP